MRTVEAIDVLCEGCGKVALFRAIDDVRTCGWLLPFLYTEGRDGQTLCPDCVTKEKPDTTSEVAELKEQVEKLCSVLDSICQQVRNELGGLEVSRSSLSDTLGRILSEARLAGCGKID